MIPLNYVPVRFPSYRYHATKPAIIVTTPDEAEALGDGWHDAPVAPPPPDPDAEKKPFAPGANVAAIDKTDDEKNHELYSTKATEVAKALHSIESVDVLKIVRAREMLNPNGARQSVLKALDKREAELTA